MQLIKHFFSHNTLSLKLFILSLVVITVLSQLMISQSENILEDAMLNQTKQQAVVFLQSIEDQLQQLPGIPEESALQDMVIRARYHAREHQHSFIISSLYIYDTTGKVVAHSDPGLHTNKDLSGDYGNVLRDNAPHIGKDIEYEVGTGGQTMPKVDVIVPLVLRGAMFGGIEAELDLRDTMQLIREDMRAREEVASDMLG